jgi:hypothetical protein
MECPLSQTVTQINGMPPFTKINGMPPFTKINVRFPFFLIVKQTSIALSSS